MNNNFHASTFMSFMGLPNMAPSEESSAADEPRLVLLLQKPLSVFFCHFPSKPAPHCAKTKRLATFDSPIRNLPKFLKFNNTTPLPF